MREAALDAEEDYWSVIGPLVRSAGSTEGDTVARHLQAWLAARDWFAVVDRVPAQDPVFIITDAGHVGLWVTPPFTDRPTLLVLDPLQLHRQEANLQAATDIARRTDAPGSPTQRALRLRRRGETDRIAVDDVGNLSRTHPSRSRD